MSSDSSTSAEIVTAEDVFPLGLGDGLELHETTETDAEEAFAVVDAERERLREWLPWVDGTTDLVIESDYLRGIEHSNAVGTGLHATIRVDGQFCGFVGFRISDSRRTAEIGYWLAEGCAGRGIMTRAVAAMFDVGFRHLGMHRLELLAATENTRSRAIAERLGMAFEGVRREAEEIATGFVDLAMYALLVQEWPGAASAQEHSRGNDRRPEQPEHLN